MHKRIIFLLFIISCGILLALLNFTTPSGVGPFGVLVFFLVFYVFLFSIATGFVAIFKKMSGKRFSGLKEEYFYAAAISSGPIFLLLMQAFDALNIFTIVLDIFFVILLCFLIKNRHNMIK